MESLNEYFKNCLFFSAGSLYRAVTRMAEECFAPLGFSPSHAFLVMLVLENPGISQKDLAQALHLAPSTITRMVDSLVAKGLLKRQSKPRSATIYPLDKARNLADDIEEAWKRLYQHYSEALGEEAGKTLTVQTFLAARKLEQA